MIMQFYKFISSSKNKISKEAYNALGDEENYYSLQEDETILKKPETEIDFQKPKKIFEEDLSGNEKSHIPLKLKEKETNIIKEETQNSQFSSKNCYHNNKNNFFQKKNELFPTKARIDLEKNNNENELKSLKGEINLEKMEKIVKNPKKDSIKDSNPLYSMENQYANYIVEKIDLPEKDLKNKNYPNQLSKKIHFLFKKAKNTIIEEDLEEYLEKKVDKIADILLNKKNEKTIYSFKNREIRKTSLRRKKNAFIIGIVTILLTSGTTVYFLREEKKEVHNIYVAEKP